jgi:hypothetical protein
MASRRDLAWPSIVAAATAIAAAVGTTVGGDYGLCLGGDLCVDDPADAIRALSLGHFGDFFASQSTQGLVAMAARLPLTIPVYAVGDSELWAYRLGSLVCLVPVAALGVWLSSYARSPLERLLVVVLPVAMTVLAGALYWGHPEEALGGALCVAAVVLASRGRGMAAGVVAGLAVATKGWALLALPVCFVALPPAARRRFALAAAGTIAAATAPLVLGDPDRFFAAQRVAAHPLKVSPFDVWWPIAGDGRSRSLPASVDWLPRTLILAIGTGAAVAWAARDRRAKDPLLLLAFVLLVRGALDSGACAYYYVPALLALLASEVLARRPPVITLAAAALVVLMQVHQRAGPSSADDIYNLGYIVGLAVLIAVVGTRTFGRGGPAVSDAARHR